MKIYVAAKSEKKEKVLDLYREIRKLGHSISYDWTVHENYKPYEKNQKTARKYSERELLGIISSDVFIYLSHEFGTTLKMEFGAALSLNKTTGKPIIFAVGNFLNQSPWLFNPSVRRRKNTRQVLKEIAEL